MKSGLLGYPLLFAVSACYAGALAIATFIGYGELEITAQTSFGPFNFVASVVMSALAAYGPLGFFLGGGIGTWLGIRLSAHVPDNFLT